MTKINLSKRLLAIANMVDKGSCLLDVGCDHALLDIYLLQNKIIKKSIAADITIGALNQAKKNISLSNVSNVETRLGDGLDILYENDSVDTLVISGLGNQKITSILYDNKKKLSNINTLIIQSNTGYYDIRKEIVKLGYYVEDESLVRENNIIYVIIKFCKGKKVYSKRNLYFGPCLLKNKNELFNELVINEINKNRIIIKRLPKRKFMKKIKLKFKNYFLKKEVL